MFKKSIIFSFVIIFMFAVAVHAQQRFVANLTASQVVPANNSSGKGVCKFTLNSAETSILIECSYSNLSSATNGFLNLGNAAVGQNPAFVISVLTGTGGTSGSFTKNVNLTPLQIAEFRANRFFAGLESASGPGFGLRGQIHLANGTYNDYDGDSRADLVVYRASNSNYYSLGSLNRNYREQNFGTSGGSSSLNADYDGDGLTDFSIGNKYFAAG